MNYLFLSFIPLLGAIFIEIFSDKLSVNGLSGITLALVVSVLYIVFSVLLMAFVSTTKVKNEQKYILYLVVLFVMAIKVLTMLSGAGAV